MNTWMIYLSGDIQWLISNAVEPMLKVMAVAMPIFVFLMVWDLVWKFVAMRKAGRNNQLGRFVCLAIFNTLGILPIVYIFWFQKKKEENIETPGSIN